MKIDIEELIKKRLNCEWVLCEDSISDEMINDAIAKEESEFAIVLNPNEIKRIKKNFNYGCAYPFLKKFFVTGIFELGEIKPYSYDLYSSIHSYGLDEYFRECSLVTFSRIKPKRIKICAIPRNKENGEIQKELDYKTYYTDLEKFINSSEVSENLKSLTNEILYANYRKEEFNVKYYSKEYLSCLKDLKKRKEKIIPLGELVEIFDPKKIYEKSKVSRQIEGSFEKLQHHSLKVNELPIRHGYLPLKKGDILVHADKYFGDVYLFNEDSNIVVSPGDNAVLRLNSTLITAEYLFWYLKSDIAKILSAPILSDVYNGKDWGVIWSIPVPIPNTDGPMLLNKELSQWYRDWFNAIYRPDLLRKGQNYYTLIQGYDGASDAVGENTLFVYFKSPHAQSLSKYAHENMKEIDVDIRNESYLSAIALIGSVLESILIDWAGELDRKDYFSEPYRRSNVDGKMYEWKLSLNDAICHIASILKTWDAKERADAIREMRNYIHVGAYLKYNKKITQEDCISARENLMAVIKSRYGDFSCRSIIEE